jgi:hypothetical protein
MAYYYYFQKKQQQQQLLLLRGFTSNYITIDGTTSMASMIA